MKSLLFQFQMLCQARTKRLIVVTGVIVALIFVFQTFTLPSRISVSPHFTALTTPLKNSSFLPRQDTSISSLRVGKLTLLSDSIDSSVVSEKVEDSKSSNVGNKNHHNDSVIENKDGDSAEDNDSDDDIDLDEDGDPDTEFSFDLGDGVVLKKGKDPVDGFITLERVVDPKHNTSLDKVDETGSNDSVAERISIPNQSLMLGKTNNLDNESIPAIFMNVELQGISNGSSSGQAVNSIIPLSGENVTKLVSSPGQISKGRVYKDKTFVPLQNDSITLKASSTEISIPLVKKKKRVMPPVSMSEMNRLLLHNRASYHSMRPRWSSARDKEMLAAKAQIENGPIVKADRQLYEPLFRNISTFKRSYEVMERRLKIYVYKEGQKPIFHEPLLKGIYASEGWFMKHMETNRRYVVKDPRKAHLFYMPFSSRLLQFALYVRNSHNRTNMERHLRDYVDLIASKYPFWNRTGGADHFLAACHDWAPYETRHAMERAIRALCVADLREGFRLGKDVSLPETYVRSAKNPLKDLGGKPAKTRKILAFFAGNMRGRVRPILLHHWENKDPDMKIFGPMPKGAGRKTAYIEYMKNSKYCICPRGYEANSPRVVESIFFECVPVIISDNYVPPFFEVLNWEAFSVIIPEKEIPRLKEILTSIPEEKYLSLQKGVMRVQKHFLWHPKPVKYDLFHMILHSIWFNRVHNVRTR